MARSIEFTTEKTKYEPNEKLWNEMRYVKLRKYTIKSSSLKYHEAILTRIKSKTAFREAHGTTIIIATI